MALRRSPASFVRLIGLSRKRVENSVWVRAISSARPGAVTPSRGVNRASGVGFEKRDHGQTSWQMSQPKTQFSRFDPIGSGSTSSRSSIVPYEIHFVASSRYGSISAPVGQASRQAVHLPQ